MKHTAWLYGKVLRTKPTGGNHLQSLPHQSPSSLQVSWQCGPGQVGSNQAEVHISVGTRGLHDCQAPSPTNSPAQIVCNSSKKGLWSLTITPLLSAQWQRQPIWGASWESSGLGCGGFQVPLGERTQVRQVTFGLDEVCCIQVLDVQTCICLATWCTYPMSGRWSGSG